MRHEIKVAKRMVARPRASVREGWLVDWPMVLLVVFASLAILALWPVATQTYAQEGGVIETTSAALLVAAALVSVFRFSGFGRYYLALGCLLLAERELDADSYVAGGAIHSILSTLDQVLDIPLVRIGLALLILGSTLRYGPGFLRRAWALRLPVLPVLAVGGLAAVVAQVLEKTAGFYGAALSTTAMARFLVLEETLELFFSVGLLAAVVIGWRERKTKETD